MIGFERRLERAAKLLERWESSQSSIQSFYGNGLKILPVYVVEVSENGHSIIVSPLDSNEKHEAFPLSPIPTSLEDGRRLQGIPTAIDDFKHGDTALCAVLDRNWYILGYFNLPDSETSEKVSYVEECEPFNPFENGIIFKLSKLGQIIFRKSNWIKVFLGEWAKIDIKGPNPLDKTVEPTITTKFPNFIQKAWGGIKKWTRKREEGTREIDWTTTYTEAITKSQEPEAISDIKLGKKVKNVAIDDVQDMTSSQSTNSPDNVYGLTYIDKVIKRAGTIGDDTHVYERETRQSINGDNEKTAFTTLREGYREGVLREYTTENTLASTLTGEKLGAEIGDNARIFIKEYKKHDGSEEQLPLNILTEEFGQGSDDMYVHRIVDAAGNYTQTQFTSNGLVTQVGTTSEGTDTILFTHTRGFDGTTTMTQGSGSDGVTIIGTPDGTYTVKTKTKVILEAPNIEIGEGATEKIVLGNAFMSYFNGHVHATGVGPSAPPTVPMADGQLSTKHTVI